jgi:hypothetical protein
MNANQEVIGIKTEVTQNTQIALTAADYFLAWDVSDPSPIVEVLPREYQHMSLDQLLSARGEVMVEVAFKTEMIGSGTAGTPIAHIGAILQAMGSSETDNGTTSETYAPVSVPASANFFTIGKSVTVEIYKGSTSAQSGLKHSIKGGVVSDLKLKLSAGKLAYWEVKVQGLYVAVADATAPATVTYSAIIAPKVEAITFSLHSLAAVATEIEIDFGVEVHKRIDVNSADGIKGFMVVNRKPKASVTVEAILVATHDYYGKLKSGISGAMSFEINNVAGNTHTFTFAQTQYTKIAQVNNGGLLMFKVDLQINVSSSLNDWYSYVQT